MRNSKLFVTVRIITAVCAAWGWWGVLYPELTMMGDTYRVVYEDAAVQEENSMRGGKPVQENAVSEKSPMQGENLMQEQSAVQENAEVVEWTSDKNIYNTLLYTDRSRIRFRSRLLMNLTALQEQERGIHDSGRED